MKAIANLKKIWRIILVQIDDFAKVKASVFFSLVRQNLFGRTVEANKMIENKSFR